MKQVHISFLISGHVNQVIEVPDNYDEDYIVYMLNTGGILTTLQEDGKVVALENNQFKEIGTVLETTPEADYSEQIILNLKNYNS